MLNGVLNKEAWWFLGPVRALKALKSSTVLIAMAPVALVLLILRPFILVRVARLRTDAIGHLAINQEMYLCERDAGLHPPRSFDIFFLGSYPVANRQLAKMWSGPLHISRFAYYLHLALSVYPGFKRHVFETSARDRHGLSSDSKPHLSFTRDEMESGKAALLDMDVRSDHVCIYARDSAYKHAVDPSRDWSYHDYNNMDVNTYVPAAEKLADRGYHVLRMGSAVDKRIGSGHPGVIDYAANGKRTDFLDIYLSATCRFFISSGSGIDSVPKIFHRPLLFVNSIPLEYMRAESRHDLIIFKKLWMQDERRFMTFREILESGAGRLLKTKEYAERHLEIVENTPEEIEAAAIEMDERLKGTWRITDEDEELQRRFWAPFKPNALNAVFLARIGTDYLRQNQNLLA